MKILRRGKLFNSVKVGPSEITNWKETDMYTATLDDKLIKLDNGKGDITYTSLYNCCWFTIEEKEDKEDLIKRAGNSSPKRGKKKKSL